MVAGNFILLNLFVSVINDGLAFVQQNPEEAEFDAAMASYLTVSLLLVLLLVLISSHFFQFFCLIFW